MENRLCFLAGRPEANNSPHMPTPEEVETRYPEQLARLRAATSMEQLDIGLLAAANDPQKFEEIVRMRSTTLESRSKELSGTFTLELADAKKQIPVLLQNKERAEVLAIINALTKPLTPRTTVPFHRYGNSDTGINFQAVEADQHYLRSIQPGFPQAAQYLQRINEALTRLAQQDIRYETRQYEQSKDKRADNFVGELSQFGGVLVMVAGTLLTGIPAIMHGWKTGKFEFKDYIPALLYASLGGIIASPSLRRQLFSSSQQNTVTEIDSTVNNPKFRSLCEDYGIQGRAWARSVRTMMEQPTETKKLTQKMRSKKMGKSTEDPDIKKYLASVTDPKVKIQLATMIDEGRFADFVHILGCTTTNDSRGLILDYINLGKRPFNQQIQSVVSRLKEAGIRDV